METRKFRLTFTEPILGTLSGNPEIAKEFIASKHPQGVQPDEIRAIEELGEAEEKQMTLFAKEEGRPFLWNYVIRGNIKTAFETIFCDSGEYTKEQQKKLLMTKYLLKKTVDRMIHVWPRKIFIQNPGEFFYLQRPIRCQTMKGERVSLACAEALPAGGFIDIEVECLNEIHPPLLDLWLDYAGKYHGIGQWRSGGYGTFTWEERE